MKFYPAWAEVNLNSLDENLQSIRDEIGNNVKIAPVLKHDAYGHGAVVIAKRLMQSKDIAMFCLETVAECEALRKENINLPLLLLSDFYEKELQIIIEKDIVVSIYSLEKAELLNKAAKKAGKRCSVHLRVDTDNECDGITIQDFQEVYAKTRELKNLKIDGVYTQIYGDYSGQEEERIKKQTEDFEEVIEMIPEKHRKSIIAHAAGSESLFKYPETYFDMVRPGLTLYYRLKPIAVKTQEGVSHSIEIKPIMRIKARIEAIYEITTDIRQNLGRLDIDETCKNVADLSISWWDTGYFFMEKGGYAMIRGKKVPVITSPQMDRILIDITSVKDATVEDEVILLGEPEDNVASSREDLEYSNFRRMLHIGERLPKKYTNWTEHAIEFPSFVLYHIRRELPKFDELLNEYGNKTLEQYLASIDVIEMEPLEPREEVGESVYNRALPLFGEEIAAEVRDYCSQKDALLYTAAHHGVDFDAGQIQSNLIYYRYLQRTGRNSTVVPVLACGGVDMSSGTYPRGLQCYSTTTPRIDNDMEIMRIPVFDNQYANTVVYDTPPFDDKMVEKAMENLNKTDIKTFLTEPVFKTFGKILKEAYLDEEVKAQDSYAKQASIMNRKIQKYLIDGKTSPDFIYLQLEDITEDLILKDLDKKNSLMYNILFNEELRDEIILQADGCAGCWTSSALRQMAENPNEKITARHHGSQFFWGINKAHRRIPMYLEKVENGTTYICGITKDAENFKYEFTPDSIRELMAEKKIYPGLFLVMTSLKFIRGFNLAGGCFQIEYTKKMRNSLCKALRKFPKFKEAEDIIKVATDDCYINGPMFGLVEDAFGGYVQAGTAEIIARGGIRENEFHKLLNISFHDAAMIGTLTMYSDVFAQKDRIHNWHSELSGGLERIYETICLSNGK